MSRQEVLNAFEIDFNNPGSEKSGEYLLGHILNSARRIITTDRISLIEVLSDWLDMDIHNEPYNTLAVIVIRELRIIELKSKLEFVKDRVLKDRTYNKAIKFEYIRDIDTTLSVLSL